MKDWQKWFVPVFVIVLTILAAAMRWYHIEWSNLFIDEAWSGYVALHPWWMIGSLDVHPAGAYALIKIAVDLMGVSELSIRIVPFIFGVISIPLSYYFAKEFTGSDFPSILTAILMTVNIAQVEQAQYGRLYTTLIVLFMLFVIFFMRAYQNRGDKWWYLATVMAIVMMWTWYYSAIFIGLTLAWYFLRDGKKVLKNLPFLYSSIGFIVAVALLVPSFYVAWQLKMQENNNLIFLGLNVIYQIGVSQLGSPAVLALFIALLAIVGWWLYYRDNEVYAGYFGFLVLGMLTVGALMSYKLMILPRYFVYLDVIFYMMIAYLICRVLYSTKNEKKNVIAAIFVVLVVVSSFALVLPAWYSAPHDWSGDWRTHHEDFEKIKGSADEVALVGNPAYVLMFDYYAKDPNVSFDRFDNLSGLKQLIKDKDSLVLVPDYPIPTDQPEARVIYDWLQDNGNRTTTYRGFEVYEVHY